MRRNHHRRVRLRVQRPNVPEEVSPGAYLAALQMIQPPAKGESADDAVPVPEARALIDIWGVQALARAFSTLICVAMEAVKPAPGDGGCLHLIVPAVLPGSAIRRRGRRTSR